MWLSAEFNLRVIEAYDEVARKEREETIKELHNVIDDFKYEMLTRPERIVYKESLTTPKPQVCKRCVDQMIIQAKQQALNNAQSNGMIGTLNGDINSLQGKLSGMAVMGVGVLMRTLLRG